jgi:hypothetical protein
VTDVRFSGSRAAGSEHALSDWDFLVEAADFGRLRGDLPGLVEPLRPLAARWDPYSDHVCFMVMLPGPTKVDLIFPSVPQEWAPPWDVSAETLPAIDEHFWDWVLWLAQKELGGSDLTESIADLHRLLLAPMGASAAPISIEDALATYLELRGRLEERYGFRVPRELQREVEPALTRMPR